MRHFVHESDQEDKGIEVAIDRDSVTAFCCWGSIIAQFGKAWIFDAQLNFVVRHQIGGVVFAPAGQIFF